MSFNSIQIPTREEILSKSKSKNDTKWKTESKSEIIPGLWVGNWSSTKDLDFIKTLGALICVNKEKVHTDEFKQYLKDHKIEFLNWTMDDDEKDFTSVHYAWKKSYDLICRTLQSNAPILLHCSAGMNRSASIVVYFLLCRLYLDKMKPDSFLTKHIISWMITKRSVICPSNTMIEHLILAECYLIDEKRKTTKKTSPRPTIL